MAADRITFKLIALGNPLLDMQVVDEDKSILKKYDLKPNDAILAEEKHTPIYEELRKRSDIKYVAGGAAQNAARAAQFILPPNSVAYVGSVGDDSLAKQIREANDAEGVASLYQITEGVPTGACAVVITDHNRSLCTQLGAAEKFTQAHLDTPDVKKAIEQAQFYYLGGFFLTHGVESAEKLAKHAAESGKIFAMNLSAPFIAEFFKTQVDTILPYVDILIGNESEARAYAKAASWDTEDIPTIATKLSTVPRTLSQAATRPPRLVIITQGAESTFVIGGPRASASTVAAENPTDPNEPTGAPVRGAPKGGKTYAVEPLPEGAIVDTNGAGDAFAGGFLGAYTEGRGLDEAVEEGHKLGRKCCTKIGPNWRDDL